MPSHDGRRDGQRRILPFLGIEKIAADGARLVGLLLIGLLGCRLTESGTIVAGELEAIREEVRSPREPEREPKRRRQDHDCDDDDFVGSFVGSVVGEFLSVLLFTGDTYQGYPVTWGFPSFPYQHEYPDYLIPDTLFEIPQSAWGGRARLGYGLDFHHVQFATAGLQVETSGRLGFEFNYAGYLEDLVPGSDDLHFTSTNLLWRAGQSTNHLFRLGGGLNSMHDSLGSDFGPNFTAQLDLFLGRPWIFSGRLDLGAIGSAGVVHGNVSVGRMLGRWEAFLGYDVRQVGAVDVDGFEFGLRLWF